MDIDALSLNELKALRSKVDRAIVTYEERKKKEAYAELDEIARKMGYPLAEILSMVEAKPRKTVAAKYANPANPAETWSGRGRKPRWFEAAIKAGEPAESMAV